MITFDVGGERRITIYSSLLDKVADSPLAAMVSGRHKLNLKEGAIFVDRDPDVFMLLIDYLRNDFHMPPIKDEFLKGRFEFELDHWLIKPIPKE